MDFSEFIILFLLVYVLLNLIGIIYYLTLGDYRTAMLREIWDIGKIFYLGDLIFSLILYILSIPCKLLSTLIIFISYIFWNKYTKKLYYIKIGGK